jgi:hypothetical protein
MIGWIVMVDAGIGLANMFSVAFLALLSYLLGGGT